MRLPISTTQSSEHPSQLAGYRKSINVFAAQATKDADPPAAVIPTPGLDLVCTIPGDEVRAIINIDDTYQFAVVDNNIYSLSIDPDTKTGVATQILEISTYTGRVKWAQNPTQVMLVDGSTSGYIITIATSTAAEITDSDFTGGSDVVFMDGYFIYSEPDSGRLHSTAINDGTSVAALDVATAEGKPDKIVGLAVDKRELVVFGTRSVEFWYNAANASGFPFSRREGAFIDLGCVSGDTIVSVDNRIAWMDNRNIVNVIESYNPTAVATPEITAKFQSALVGTDTYAFSYEHQGHVFYAVTSPSQRITMVLDLGTGLWHQLADYWNDVGFIESNIALSERYKQTHLVGEKYSGKIFFFNPNTYTRGGSGIKRVFTSNTYTLENKLVGVVSLELYAEVGFGNVTGEAVSPNIELRYSNDGGHTWSDYIPRSLGAIGEYNTKITWNRLGTERSWLFEFSTDAAIKLSFLDLFIDVEVEA